MDIEEIIRHKIENELEITREEVLTRVKKDGLKLKFHHQFFEDEEIVTEAVKQNYQAISYAEGNILNNKELFKFILNQDGAYLRRAGDAVKNDFDLVFLAFQHNGSIINASPRLKKSKELAIMMTNAIPKRAAWDLAFFHKSIRDDYEVVDLMTYRFPEALQYASKRLRNDKKLVMKLVLDDAMNLEYAGSEIKKDLDILSIAYKKNKNSSQFFSANLLPHVLNHMEKINEKIQVTEKNKSVPKL